MDRTGIIYNREPRRLAPTPRGAAIWGPAEGLRPAAAGADPSPGILPSGTVDFDQSFSRQSAVGMADSRGIAYKKSVVSFVSGFRRPYGPGG